MTGIGSVKPSSQSAIEHIIISELRAVQHSTSNESTA